MPDRRTRKGVEIARVGTFRLSTGQHTFTREQLAAAARNAAEFTPRVGIGHIDPRWNPPGHDGDPAFGKVTNLQLTDDGDVLVGDLDGLAPWLDDSLEIAYPGRSLEGKVNGDDLRITAVKLLGTTEPGISTLKDLEHAIAASVEAGDTSSEQATVAFRTLWASVNLDDLRDAFYAEHPTDPNNSEWWAVQEIQINPNQLIVEHHAGQETTYRVPWTVNTDGTFQFGDLTEVAVQYVDVAASAVAERVIYRASVARPTPQPARRSLVDPKILREQLGLAEDASDEDVTAKLAEFKARPTEEQVNEQVTAKAEELAAEKVAAAAATGPTAEHLAELQAAAAQGVEARKVQLEQDRTQFLSAAAGDGRIPPAAVKSYRDQLDKGGDIEKATREFIDGLPKNTIPVDEIGVEASSDTDAPATTGWFPQLQEA